MADTRCPRLPLERFVAGELTGEAAKAVETHIGSCARCGALFARMKKDRAEFLRVHPFADLRATGAVGQSGELWYERFLRLFAIPALRPVLIPACVAVLVGIMVLPFTGFRGLFVLEEHNGIRYKGADGPLSYIYKRGGTVYESAPGDRFEPGDKLQLFYDSHADQYLALLSVSPGGALSFYHPEDKAKSCSIRTGVGNRLAWPVGIELDSAAGDELMIAAYSAAPLDTAQVRGWIGLHRKSGVSLSSLATMLQKNPPVKGGAVATLLFQKRRSHP